MYNLLRYLRPFHQLSLHYLSWLDCLWDNQFVAFDELGTSGRGRHFSKRIIRFLFVASLALKTLSDVVVDGVIKFVQIFKSSSTFLFESIEAVVNF